MTFPYLTEEGTEVKRLTKVTLRRHAQVSPDGTASEALQSLPCPGWNLPTGCAVPECIGWNFNAEGIRKMDL